MEMEHGNSKKIYRQGHNHIFVLWSIHNIKHIYLSVFDFLFPHTRIMDSKPFFIFLFLLIGITHTSIQIETMTLPSIPY